MRAFTQTLAKIAMRTMGGDVFLERKNSVIPINEWDKLDIIASLVEQELYGDQKEDE